MLKATEKLPKNPTLSKSEWLTFPVCLVVLLGLFSWLGWPGFSAGFCSLLFYLVWNQVNDCFDAFARTWEGNLVFMDHLAWSRPLIWEAKQQKTHLNRKWHLEKEVLQLDTVSYKRFPGFFGGDCFLTCFLVQSVSWQSWHLWWISIHTSTDPTRHQVLNSNHILAQKLRTNHSTWDFNSSATLFTWSVFNPKSTLEPRA